MSTDAVTLSDITSADWSLALDRNGGIGRVVQGIEDVNQAIEIILTTPKGSDVLRPTFGADLWRYIDLPINAATAAIVREVTDAITRWEPRVKLISVSAKPLVAGVEQPGAHLEVSATWQLKLASAPAPGQTTTVTIGGAT